MSEAYERDLVAEGPSVLERVSYAGVGIGLVGVFVAVTSLLRWTSVDQTFAGVSLFQYYGLGLLVLGLLTVGLGALSRLELVETSPDRTVGIPTAALFGGLWFVVAGLVAGNTLGLGSAGWFVVAPLVGVAVTVASLFVREDVGTTVPTGLLVAFAGAIVLIGVVDQGWSWNPEGLSITVPAAIGVPLLAAVANLLGTWTTAKASAGFGTRGRQRGAFMLISLVVFVTLSILVLLIAFIVKRGLGTVLENVVVGAVPGLVVAGVVTAVLANRIYRDGLRFATRREAVTSALTLVATSAFGLATLAFLYVLATGTTLSALGATVAPAVAFDWPFVMNPSQGLGIQQGVMPAVIGTIWLVLGAVVFAVPLAVGAAVYLTEYAEDSKFTRGVQVATNGLWSTPSIVFGLFGLAFLVPRFGNSQSILAGQLVLGFMLLPLVLITSHEAMKSVPDEYRDASAALGVTQWETIRSVVIPAAMPGIITGVILGVGRIAGETAPILLVTGGANFPSQGPGVLQSFTVSVTARPPFLQVTNDALLSAASALPYQLYAVIKAGVGGNESFAWGTALVLLGVVLSFYAIGIASRTYFRRKLNQ